MGLRTACLSLTAVFLIVFVFISIISDDIQGTELKGEDEGKIKPERSKEKKSNVKKRESGLMDEFGNDEIQVGGKRFKLFEKKNLNYKKATAYCKKNDGKLAEAMNLEEMRRLQILLMKARSIGNDMWVGADKKEWKKHSLKMQRRPNFGPDPMLFGGGPTEMCPALSVSTRSLTPVSCNRDLPFICEFGPGTAKSGTKPEKKSGKAETGGKSKGKAKSKVEMRRKREIVLSSSEITKKDETTVANTDPDETTEKYMTESPAEAAAEHNIGFSPHVEHLQLEGLTSDEPEEISSLTIRATTLKRVQENTKASTTTLDPDQMLIDLIDEQTVNLTAIELEAMNTSATLETQVPTSQVPLPNASPSTDLKVSQKFVEFMDSNDIGDNPATASLDPDYANNSALVLSEEFQRGNTSDSVDSFSTVMLNSSELPPSTSPVTFNFSATSGTKKPPEEILEGNKRQLRNASHPHHGESKVEENTKVENMGKAATPSNVEAVDTLNYTNLQAITPSTLETTLNSSGNNTMPNWDRSGTSATATSPLLESSMMPASESSSLNFSTQSGNQTSYEDLYLTTETETDISNNTLADME